MTKRVYRAAMGFGGMGGIALGFAGSPDFEGAKAHLFGNEATFELAGSTDFDPYACKAYTYLTGETQTEIDLATATPEDMRRIYGETAPDVMAGSPPCKAASLLCSTAKSKTPKYAAMMELALVWTRLILAAWPTRPPRLLIYENVPTITSRGRGMIQEIKRLLKGTYAFQDGYHECGEIGGLAQKRRRWLFVARLTHCPDAPERCVPFFLYKPPTHRVRGCGEVLGELPLPGDPRGGSMHKLPRISAVQWFRLAAIPAGQDWRALKDVLNGRAKREVFRRYLVGDWQTPCATIGGPGTNGPYGVADPRAQLPPFSVAGLPAHDLYGHVDRVTCWSSPVGTITRAPAPSSGGAAVARPQDG